MVRLSAVPGTTNDELADFLGFLFEGQKGWVHAPTLDREILDDKGNPTYQPYFFQWPIERAALQTHITNNTAERDVYLAPALYNTDRATKETFLGTQVVWCEFDGNLPSQDHLATCGLPLPSIRIKSSDEKHEHWYWRLDSFITDIVAVESVNRGLTYNLGADTSGWDATQILRPPRTLNHKRGKPVTLVDSSNAVQGLSIFGSISSAPKLATNFQVEDMVDTLEIVSKYQWPKEYFTLYRTREIEPGDRSTAMMRLAYMCAEMGMSDREIFSIMYSADDRWGKFRTRPDRIHRLNDIVLKARLKHPVGVSQALTGQLSELPSYGFNTFLQTEVVIEWIIPGMLQKQGYMMVTGPSGVGKTQWSLRFAMALAMGKAFCGYEISAPIKTLFFSLEMGHADLQFFLSDMAKTLQPEDYSLLEENLVLIPHGEPLYLDSEEGRKLFDSAMKAHTPDVFFFDSLGSASTTELSQEATAKTLMDWNDRARKSYNCASWFIHHMRKANGTNTKPNKQDDVYGNQYIFNRATSVYCLWPDKKNSNTIEVICLKKRLGPKEEPQVIERVKHIDFKQSTVMTAAERLPTGQTSNTSTSTSAGTHTTVEYKPPPVPTPTQPTQESKDPEPSPNKPKPDSTFDL